jgi:hypothetical protein
MIFSLFGKKQEAYVISRVLYDMMKKDNNLYKLKEMLSTSEDAVFYTNFKTQESFITDAVLNEKDKHNAKNLMLKLTISLEEAEDLLLSKNMDALYAITSRQVWLKRAAEKRGIKLKVFKV